MIILAGDIGGTKTWLQIAEFSSAQDHHNVLYEQLFVSARYPVFDALLEEFLNSAEQAGVPLPKQACIGVAGPIDVDAQGSCTAKVTNLPWFLAAKVLAAQFHFDHLHLINDFQAIGYGLERLTSDEVLVLQEGESSGQLRHSPQALIGAGTGLGQGLLVWEGDADTGHYKVLSSEGGHTDFAPGNSEQRALMHFLAASQPRVSVEDVLSGRGLVNIYRYLADSHPDEINGELTEAMTRGDAAAAISEAAFSGASVLADRALNLFVNIYGTQAGNLALTCVASGGVFIAGGIAPKIQSRFKTGIFLEAFCDKGPMTAMMKKIPVTLVLNPQVGLKGAALVASRL